MNKRKAEADRCKKCPLLRLVLKDKALVKSSAKTGVLKTIFERDLHLKID